MNRSRKLFELAKFAGWLLSPLSVALLGGLLALLLVWLGRRRLGLALAALCLAMLWLFSTPWLAGTLAEHLESQYPPVAVEATPSADAILVLGGAVVAANPPLQPHLSLKNAADRVWHAGALYRAGKARWVLLSGGNQPGYEDQPPEAQAMREMLRVLGVPDDAMRLEGRSRNTRENAAFSRDLVQAVRARRVLLVTSAMHMPRALATFRAAFAGTGVAFLPASTDADALGDELDPLGQWLPDARSLEWCSRAIKEVLGLLQINVAQKALTDNGVQGKSVHAR